MAVAGLCRALLLGSVAASGVTSSRAPGIAFSPRLDHQMNLYFREQPVGRFIQPSVSTYRVEVTYESLPLACKSSGLGGRTASCRLGRKFHFFEYQQRTVLHF